ncbi:MAG TPA: hypothetical protein VGK10_15445 [Prolixibacteraceae bacterium]|jgi:hypothetical protein
MRKKPEYVFRILGEGGGIGISRMTINGQQRFLTAHHEFDPSDEGLEVNKEIGYSSFEEAFTYVSKYPWHLLYMERVHEDYRIFVLDRLMEVLNGERGDGSYYRERKREDHQELFSVRIFQDASGVWSYSFEKIDPSPKDKGYK